MGLAHKLEYVEMIVAHMKSTKGDAIPYQLVIHADDGGTYFQSYDSTIACLRADGGVELDSRYWDYSVTTGKYLNKFLRESKAETRRKIDSGEYVLTNLN